MEVKINKEIRNYTESMFFGLSLRQFIFSVLACSVAVGLYFLLRPRFGTEMERIIKRGDIYYAELNPVIGSEQGGTRPVLIISNDIGNKHSPTVIIAPITSRVHTKAKLPTHTLIKDFDGLDKNSIILFEQIRTIDKQRLREYLGTLDRRFIHCADKALAISIGLAKKD